MLAQLVKNIKIFWERENLGSNFRWKWDGVSKEQMVLELIKMTKTPMMTLI